MIRISGPPASAIRNQPITSELRQLLETAGTIASVDEVRITSGGQPARGEGTRRTGSTRHDHGRAADLQLIVDGAATTFTDNSADPVVVAFVAAAASLGANGIGAGVTYMGNKTVHVGYGTSPSDHTQLTWGVGGRSATAPDWLRQAAAKGWANPQAMGAAAMPSIPGVYRVIAREGLRLRMGPGIEFESTRTLPADTEVNVVGFDGRDGEWARVDIEGDGMLDGHMFAAFLAAAMQSIGSAEDVPEPGDDET